MSGAPIANRFWSKADKSGECWIWTACRNHKGYGFFGVSGKNRGAHRVAYELAVGPIPPGLFVCHRCDVPACVNPGHLFLATNAENLRDMTEKGRRKTGADHGRSKMTVAQVRQIRALYAAGTKQVRLRAMFGMSKFGISAIVHGLTWKGVD